MENKVNESKSSHIKFTPPERSLPCSQHQPNYHTSDRSSKIPRTTLRDFKVNWKEHIAKQEKKKENKST
jgi:hypothetical protein